LSSAANVFSYYRDPHFLDFIVGLQGGTARKARNKSHAVGEASRYGGLQAREEPREV
jgi:hypothetical protein